MMRRWQEKKPQASHADDWLMTYADMITLLLCFFVVFLIISISKKTTPHKEPVQQVAEQTEHFTSPVRQPQVQVPPVQPVVKMPDVLRENPPLPKIVDPVPVKSDEPPPAKVTAAVVVLPVIAPAPVIPAPPPTHASLSEIIDNLKSQGPVHFEQKGDRITTLEMSSGTFFDSGSAALSNAGKSILHDVATNLKSDRFRDYQITVEGHTDDSPIHTAQFPSNWELSTARAAAVVQFFLEQGITAQKLRAAGYADTFPKAPNRDADGNPLPANQAQNRRVVIKLEKIEKNATSGASESGY